MKKIVLVVFIFCIPLFFILAQPREPVIKTSCEALVVCAFQQLLTGTNATNTQLQNVLSQAIKDGVLLENGKVIDREALASLVLKTLGQTEIVVTFGSEPSGKGKHIGYILEVTNNTGNCFILAGTNKEPLYNPCNFKGSVVSALEVYVYAL